MGDFMEQKYISQTMLDQILTSDQDQMLKASIPYLPYQGQKILSVYTKMQELSKAIQLYSSSGNTEICSCADSSEPLEILSDISQYCYGESRKKLEQLTNMLAIFQMMQILNNP